jgi:hypothetical protein
VEVDAEEEISPSIGRSAAAAAAVVLVEGESLTLDDVPRGALRLIRVAAVNDGGESSRPLEHRELTIRERAAAEIARRDFALERADHGA